MTSASHILCYSLPFLFLHFPLTPDALLTWLSAPPPTTSSLSSLAMSLIQRTIRAIRGRFSRIDRSKNLDSQRTDMYSMLADLYKELEGLKAEALESENLEVLPVHILPLDLKRTTELAIPRSLDPGAYFIPLSEEFIQQRPVDTTDPETQRRLNNVATILRPGYSSSTVQHRPLSSYCKAGVLVDRLVMQMSSRRLNCEEAIPNMTLITKWRGNT